MASEGLRIFALSFLFSGFNIFRLRCLQPYPMEKRQPLFRLAERVYLLSVTDDSAKYSWTYRCLARNSGCGISGSFCVGLLSVDKTEKNMGICDRMKN